MRFFTGIILFFIFCQNIYAQQILPGTWSFRTGPDGGIKAPPGAGASTFYDMTPWNSGQYKEFHFHSGTNPPAPSNFEMNFRLLFPNNYGDDIDQKYPMIVLLHGLGEAGVLGGAPRFLPYSIQDVEYWNNDHSLFHGGKQHLDAVNRPTDDPRAFPGFVFVPQNNKFWDKVAQYNVIAILEELIKTYHIDPMRIYLQGYSDGGNAVWDLAQLRPDLFAAILPISSVNGNLNIAKVLHIPIWHFQGEFDRRPTAGSARKLQKRLREAGATPRYTEYENAGHAIWDKAYAEPDYFSWMLDKSKTDIHVYFGKTEICDGDQVHVRLGVSPGFKAYQWKIVSNGQETIFEAGHDNNEIMATGYGNYYVRIGKMTNPMDKDWTEWSEPVTITQKGQPPAPDITVQGSTMLPALDGASKVTLTASDGYESYQWYKNDTLLSGKAFNGDAITVTGAGNYSLSVTPSDGCVSLMSQPITVRVQAPDNIVETPENLSARAFSETTINLTWTDRASNEQGYEIYRMVEKAGGKYQFVAKTTANRETYKDNALDPNTTYSYIIRGINNQGTSKRSNGANATTMTDFLPPTVPGMLRHTVFSTTSIELTWGPSTDNVGVVGYDIYVDGVLKNSTADTAFLMKGLKPQTLYNFTIKAKDVSGNESEVSNQLTAVTIFTGLAYKYYSGGLWAKVSDYNGWKVDKQGFINNFTINREIEGGVRPDPQGNYFAFDFEGFLYIEEAGEYKFSLRAASGSILSLDGNVIVNNDGNHKESTVVSSLLNLRAGAHKIKVQYFDRVEQEVLQVQYAGPDTGENLKDIPDEALSSSKKIFPSPPTAPGNLLAITSGTGQIDLKWSDKATDETGFEIYRALTSEGQFKKIQTTEPNTTGFEDKGLSGNTTYYYKAKAIGKNGSSGFAIAYATTALPLFYFRGDNVFNSVQLDWAVTGTMNEEQFIVERSVNEEDFIIIGKLDAGSESEDTIKFKFYDSTPRNGINYYRIRQENRSGNYGYSDTLAIDINSDAGLAIQIYPVPASGNVLNLRARLLNPQDMVTIQILDSYGRTYFIDKVNPKELRTPLNLFANSVYGPGIYIVVIEQGGQKTHQKFIVN